MVGVIVVAVESVDDGEKPERPVKRKLEVNKRPGEDNTMSSIKFPPTFPFSFSLIFFIIF